VVNKPALLPPSLQKFSEDFPHQTLLNLPVIMFAIILALREIFLKNAHFCLAACFLLLEKSGIVH
jgi:hypothetical protein